MLTYNFENYRIIFLIFIILPFLFATKVFCRVDPAVCIAGLPAKLNGGQARHTDGGQALGPPSSQAERGGRAEMGKKGW
jgi:hypothetical protein